MDSLNYEEKHIGKTDELVFTFMGVNKTSKRFVLCIGSFYKIIE